MRVRVRLFARYREATGQERLDVELPEGSTVETAWKAIVALHPDLARYRPYTLFAVGHDYVEPDHRLAPDDDLCLFPPVSGGSGSASGEMTENSPDIYAVDDRPLSPDAIAARVDDPGAGGLVIFSGVVRNQTDGRPVKFLEYEAHAPMAEAKMREIGEAIRARWAGVRRIAMLHRVGRLEIGEASVLIAVSAAHRGDAFEACRYAIDTLKRTVPVWKKEHFEDGEVWVGLQGGVGVDLVREALRTIHRQAMLAGGDTVLIGVSGGADSVALLHVLTRLAPALDLRLHVLHVDHGLRPDSARDGEFVRALGARLGVPVEVVGVHVGPGSVEAAARTARHAALEACADRLGAARIALGHTADDQAETLLMRIVEGTGVRGLAGIPAVRGRVIRPLLESRHRDAVAMLSAAGLAWLEDPSNRDERFFRNRVRHTLLPGLAEAGFPDLVERLARLARGAREAVDALDRVAAVELSRLAREEDGALVLSRSALAALPRPVAAEVLRRAAAALGSRAPLRAWGHRGLRRVLAEAPPRRPFRLGGVRVEVSGDRVRVGRAASPPLQARELAVPGRVELPEIGQALEAVVLPAAGYAPPRARDRVAFDAAGLPPRLVVRARRRGDRFRPFGGGDRRLKSFLIDAKVPRWDRDRLPLVDAGADILWVAGIRRGAAAPVTSDTGTVVESNWFRWRDFTRGR